MKKKQYIEKSKILKEIKSCLKYVQDPFEHNIHTNRLEEAYEDLIDFINDMKVKTIEITKDNNSLKEVDLEKEYEEFVVNDPILGNFITNDIMGMELAKHFFELGLKAQKGK